MHARACVTGGPMQWCASRLWPPGARPVPPAVGDVRVLLSHVRLCLLTLNACGVWVLCHDMLRAVGCR